jgi:uncharacterized protein (TIGR01777 family)
VSENGSRIAITGATGLVGSALAAALSGRGNQVIPLRRGTRQSDSTDVFWEPSGQGIIDPKALDDIDTIVHLAGENIATARWTDVQKQKIRVSRVDATRNLVRSFANCEKRPSTFVCASAIGFYGDRGSEEMTESSAPGSGFLPEVCRDWEAAAAEAEELGIRVVRVRIGVVLSPDGGALSKMLTPFKLCAGGIVGNGKQYWSWIGLSDLVRILEEAIANTALRGAVNAVSPNSVTNREFTTVLGKVLRRPTLFPLPAFAAKIMLGEMADDLLLGSTRVVPEVLNRSGFEFQHADLEACLRHELS